MMAVMVPDTVLLNEDDCSPQDTFSVGFKNIVIMRRCISTCAVEIATS